MTAHDRAVDYVPHDDPLELLFDLTFVVTVGYETAGYRHAEADIRRES